MYREHLQLLDEVLTALEKSGLKLNPEKSKFCQTEVVVLGFLLSANGLSPDPHNIQKILTWPVPKNLTETRGFVGLVSFYCQFIQSYSHIAAPLTDLSKKDAPFVWSPECQTAFETLVKSVTSDSVIAVPDFSEEFILKTDASLIAIGCVLQQIQEGLTKVISFDSKKLTDRQSSWVVFDREFFSLYNWV